MRSLPRLGMAAAVPALFLSCLTACGSSVWRQMVSAQVDPTAQDEQTVKHTVPLGGDGPHIVDLRAIAGSIHVSGYDGTEVQLKVRKPISGRTAADRQRGDEEVRLTIADNGSSVEAIVRDPYGPPCGEDGASQRNQLPFRVRFDFGVEPLATSGRMERQNGRLIYRANEFTTVRVGRAAR